MEVTAFFHWYMTRSDRPLLWSSSQMNKDSWCSFAESCPNASIEIRRTSSVIQNDFCGVMILFWWHDFCSLDYQLRQLLCRPTRWLHRRTIGPEHVVPMNIKRWTGSMHPFYQNFVHLVDQPWHALTFQAMREIDPSFALNSMMDSGPIKTAIRERTGSSHAVLQFVSCRASPVGAR